MGEDHGPDETDPGGDPGGQQGGDAGQHVRTEENRAQGRGLNAESDHEPVRQHALNDEASAEGVKSEQDR